MIENFLVPSLSFKKVGQWDMFNHLTKNIDRDLYKGAIAGQKKVVEKIASIVKGHLRNQDLKWKPLNKAYASRKANDYILLKSWKYYNAISIQRTKRDEFFVGVEKGLYYRGRWGSIQVAYMAYLHEVGTTGIWGKPIELPARPLWKPSIKEFQKNFGIEETITKAIRTHLKSVGWGNVTLKHLRKYEAPV